MTWGIHIWDSDVPNYAKLDVGDLVVLHDSEWALGVARLLESWLVQLAA